MLVSSGKPEEKKQMLTFSHSFPRQVHLRDHERGRPRLHLLPGGRGREREGLPLLPEGQEAAGHLRPLSSRAARRPDRPLLRPRTPRQEGRVWRLSPVHVPPGREPAARRQVVQAGGGDGGLG